MNWGLALSGLLYPTVGLALFVAWGFAALWEERGKRTKAFIMRALVLTLACSPLTWSLWRVYRDLGGDGLRFGLVASTGFVLLYLAAFRVRAKLDAYCARRRAECSPDV